MRILEYSGLENTRVAKSISFDDAQHAIYGEPAPMVMVGSTCSGKTALRLEELIQRQLLAHLLQRSAQEWCSPKRDHRLPSHDERQHGDDSRAPFAPQRLLDCPSANAV